jgi:hypothetical protein
LHHLETFNCLNQHKQEGVIALLSHATHKPAAQSIGIDRSTLYRWQQDPDFRAALSDARRELSSAYTLRLLAIADKAVAALDRALTTGDSSIEIRAAREVLERIDRRLELEDVVTRLEALEREAA